MWNSLQRPRCPTQIHSKHCSRRRQCVHIFKHFAAIVFFFFFLPDGTVSYNKIFSGWQLKKQPHTLGSHGGVNGNPLSRVLLTKKRPLVDPLESRSRSLSSDPDARARLARLPGVLLVLTPSDSGLWASALKQSRAPGSFGVTGRSVALS